VQKAIECELNSGSIFVKQAPPTKRDYEKNGIIIKCSMKELTQTIKEYEK
jgi:hypothetical protein